MSKRISQEHFDEVVLENINDFEMSPEEAIQEALDQFKAQDVNLAQIVSNPNIYKGGVIQKQPIIETLQLISKAIDDQSEFSKHCFDFIAQCKENVSIRCLAGNNEAMSILLKKVETVEFTKICLESLIAVCTGNPDILNKDGVTIFMRLLRTSKDTSLLERLLKLIRVTCIMQERNRLMYLENDIIKLIINDIIKDNEDSQAILSESCQVLISLTLDDDVRVPFGKGTANVITIVGNGSFMKYLSKLCKQYYSNISTLNILYRTMACLSTKDEFCYLVMSSGMLANILFSMKENSQEKNLMKQCLVLLKAIAGNDDVKLAIADIGLLHIIVEIMTMYLIEPTIVRNSNAAIGACVLRQTKNCDLVMQTNYADTVVKAMIIHSADDTVVTQCATAIRNLVSRCPEHRDTLLAAGVEDPLRKACLTSSIEEIATAALRDLGLNVKLQEKWKGEGHQIERD